MGKVIVIGGGLGGLTTALALRRSGIEVELHERATAFETVGAGLTITASVRKAVDYLGFQDAFNRAVEVPERPAVFDWTSGAPLLEPGAPSPHLDGSRRISRSDFHSLLLDALEKAGGCRPTLGHTLTGFRQDEVGVTASFSNGDTASGDLMIAADGLRSTVRPMIVGPDSLRFTGYVAWRFMIPIGVASPAMRGRMIMITAGPRASLTAYTVDGGRLLNCVAIVNGGDECESSWGHRGEHAELAAWFSSANPDVRRLIDLAPRDSLYKWVLYDREPLARWTDRRVTLLGDAAHPTLPFLGSGAGMAIEDGVVLARCLEAAFGPESLARYQRARIERASVMQRAASLQGRRFGQSHDGKSAEGSPFFDESLFRYDPVTAAI